MRVGFIGLGDQGGPMARRITEEGFPLTVWARRPESLVPFATTDAKAVATPADVGAASDLVCICVVGDADVEQVLTGPTGVFASMQSGGVVVVHSTTHPRTCITLAEHAAGREITLVDAPVSGGGMAAAQRRLLVMVGGDTASADRIRPVFETFADPVIHVGALGSGQLAKLLNNLVFTAQLAIGTHMFSFADALGVDRGALASVLANGSGGSRATAIMAMMGYTAMGASRAAPLLQKDLDIVIDIANADRITDRAGPLIELAREALAILESPQ